MDTRLLKVGVMLAGGMMSACGFHLKGAVPLPEVMTVTYVDTIQPHSYFKRELTTTLTRAGATITEDREAATAVLGIHQDDSGREVLSVSAQNVPEEYLVFYTVRYSVKSGAEELVAPQTVTLTRGYSWEETEVLAKAREEEVLRQALAKDLVSIVMHQLESL